LSEKEKKSFKTSTQGGLEGQQLRPDQGRKTCETKPESVVRKIERQNVGDVDVDAGNRRVGLGVRDREGLRVPGMVPA